MNNTTDHCICGPSFWDVVLLVGAGFIFGVAVCVAFSLVVVLK